MQDTVQAAIQLAETHYANSDEPLYLASVGQALRNQQVWPLEGDKRSLKAWLTTLEPELFVLQDEARPARVAIVTPEKRAIVERTLAGLRHSELVETLARPVLIAFCVRESEESPVYLTKRPPFRYTLAQPDDPDQYHVVPPKYRLPGLKLTSAAKMPASDVAALGEGIQHWADATGVALATLTKVTAEASLAAPEEVAIGTMSALDRLIAAQRQDLRDHLVIPGDIAALLSRQR